MYTTSAESLLSSEAEQVQQFTVLGEAGQVDLGRAAATDSSTAVPRSKLLQNSGAFRELFWVFTEVQL